MQTYSIADLKNFQESNHTLLEFGKKDTILWAWANRYQYKSLQWRPTKKDFKYIFLINNGLKISKIASLTLEELSSKVL